MRHLAVAMLVSVVFVAAGGDASAQRAEGDLVPGLVGAYYALEKGPSDFPKLAEGKKPFYVRVDKTVDFDDVGEDDFYGSKLSDNFYVRWTGRIRITRAGEHRFWTASDDGSRLTIGERVVVDNGGTHGMEEKSGVVELAAGTHPIVIEFFQAQGGKGCKVAWQTPGGKREALPGAVLFHVKGEQQRIAWDKGAWEKIRKPKPSGKYALTEYGPTYSATVKGPGGNVAVKGIVISVGTKEKPANVCFDTELMRVAFGWTEGWLKLPHGRDGLEGQPSVEGTVTFATKQRSVGWSQDGRFDDPRERPYGPIDPALADYRGLYLNGDRVVLEYRVGEAGVLELPGFSSEGGADVITRTLAVENASKGLSVLVFEKAGTGVVTGGVSGSANESIAVVTDEESATGAAVVGAPAGSRWEVNDGRVVLRLPPLPQRTLLQVRVWSGKKEELAKFTSVEQRPGTMIDPATLINGGPRRWTEAVVTKGVLGREAGAYVMDTVTVPYENPYRSYMRLTGLDFFEDGRAAVSTMDGDVWIVSGIDESLGKVTWRRYATGLFQAGGLKVVEGTVYVLGRDQITRLHDLNEDGEADFYESFNNDCHAQAFYHEFALDLHTDAAGNFYYMKGSALGGNTTVHNGTMLKVSKDGKRLEVVAVGFRAANGMGVGPNGELTSGDNQGEWTPLCPINWVEPGKFYGHVHGKYSYASADSPRERPICWLPMEVDNSSGSQVWATSGKWGPLGGKLLHLSYGKCKLYAVLMEDVGGVKQGGVVGLPFKFVSGGMRGRFNPVDGQLYVVGMKGWQTDANLDGCFHRVRYTGKRANMPVGLKVRKEGVEIEFSDPLDAKSAGDAGNYGVEWFNVQRTRGYGSKEFSVSDPEKTGREEVEVNGVEVSGDGNRVLLKMPGIRPVTNMVIRFKVRGADGGVIEREISNTIHVVPG